MLKNQLQKVKDVLNKTEKQSSKKNIENLVVFLILLIITVIAINIIWGEEKNVEQIENNSTYKKLAQDIEIESNNQNFNEYDLEQRLENILSKISGVGKSEVLITYSESSEIVAMYNETYTSSNTEETDTSGGERKIEQTDTNKEIIYEEKNGEKIPITQKVVMPKIEGAIVIAQGATNANIKTNIIQAISAATGLSTYKIQVFEMTE